MIILEERHNMNLEFLRFLGEIEPTDSGVSLLTTLWETEDGQNCRRLGYQDNPKRLSELGTISARITEKELLEGSFQDSKYGKMIFRGNYSTFAGEQGIVLFDEKGVPYIYPNLTMVMNIMISKKPVR